MNWCVRLHFDFDSKNATFARTIWLDDDSSTVRVYNLLDDDEAETYTLLVDTGRPKQFAKSGEQRRHLICCDTHACVPYDDPEHAIGPMFIDHLEYYIARLSELDCVSHQVD